MISIITPTHKVTPFLDVTIKSVICQEYTDWEWVVLDNSPDFYFGGYLEGFFERHPRFDMETIRKKIKIINRHYPEGTPIGRFKNDLVGWTSCKDDEYVMLLDHDDFLDCSALAEINKMDNRYPNAQFISGDCFLMRYDDNMWYAYNMNITFGKEMLDRQCCVVDDVVDFEIKIDDFDIYFNHIPNALTHYIHPFPCSGDENPKHLKLQMHPRCIKRWCLNIDAFRFYEGVRYAEDITQLMFLGMCAQGVYIPKVIYYYVFYGDCSNATYDLVKHMGDSDMKVLTGCSEDMIQTFQTLYPEYTYMDKFLNKHELKGYEKIKDMHRRK